MMCHVRRRYRSRVENASAPLEEPETHLISGELLALQKLEFRGHLIGSKLLAEIGSVIKSQLRLIDYAFRYGGDEFVVLLPQTGKDQGLVVARRIRDSLRASEFCKAEGLNLNVRASMASQPIHTSSNSTRNYSPGGRDDVFGEKQHPGQYWRGATGRSEVTLPVATLQTETN